MQKNNPYRSFCTFLIVTLLGSVMAKPSQAVELSGTLKDFKGATVKVSLDSNAQTIMTAGEVRGDVERELQRIGLKIFSEQEGQAEPGKPQIEADIDLTSKWDKVPARSFSVGLSLREDTVSVRGVIVSAITWHKAIFGSITEEAIGDNSAGNSIRAYLQTDLNDFVKDRFTDAISLDDNKIIGKAVFPVGSTSVGGQGKNVAGVPCNHEMSEDYHIHAHLSFIVNGEQIALPAGIGIMEPIVEKNGVVKGGSCIYPVHTHGSAGIIHIETAKPTDYTLGQFFDIWGQPLLNNRIANYNGPVSAYVNGTRFYGDLRTIVFTPHMEVTIQIGTPSVTPPVYIFSDGL